MGRYVLEMFAAAELLAIRHSRICIIGKVPSMNRLLLNLSLFLFLAIFLLGACSGPSEPHPRVISEAGIQFEEYSLLLPYCESAMEARCFVPTEGTIEQILAKHSSQRSNLVNPYGRMTEDQITIDFDGAPIIASLRIIDTSSSDQNGYSMGEIVVTHRDQVLFSMPLGQLGPTPNLHGLWVSDGSWYLEVAEEAGDLDQSRGVIIQDGQSLLDRFGYEEAFSFTLIDDKPFFFYVRDGKVNASFDGQEIELRYDEVEHYQCCSAARNNPIKSENMVSYFARRGDTWYYVEAGIFQY